MSFDGGWQSHEKDQIGQAFTAKTDKNQVLVKVNKFQRLVFKLFKLVFIMDYWKMEGKILVLFFLGFTVAFGHKYKPNWESLDSRPLPQVIFKYSKKGIKITLFEIFIFFPKNSTLISRENCRVFWVKNS